MINLLPIQQKEELLLEEKFKLVLILGIIILVLFISLFLILFSIKISILSEVEVQNIYFGEREKELKAPQMQELEEKIKSSNLVISKLNSFYQKETDLTSILEEISKIFPEGTYLTSLSFNPSLLQFSLSGFSPDREALLKFKENLEGQEKFEEIYFPPTNWMTPIDINFSVSFKLK